MLLFVLLPLYFQASSHGFLTFHFKDDQERTGGNYALPKNCTIYFFLTIQGKLIN